MDQRYLNYYDTDLAFPATDGNPLAQDVESTFALVKSFSAEMKVRSWRKIKDSKNALANIFAAFLKVWLSKQQTSDLFSGFVRMSASKIHWTGRKWWLNIFLHFEGPRTSFLDL